MVKNLDNIQSKLTCRIEEIEQLAAKNSVQLGHHSMQLDHHSKQHEHHIEELERHSKELDQQSRRVKRLSEECECVHKKVRTEYHYEGKDIEEKKGINLFTLNHQKYLCNTPCAARIIYE